MLPNEKQPRPCTLWGQTFDASQVIEILRPVESLGRTASVVIYNVYQIVLDATNSRIKLPKLGWIRFRKSREVLGDVRQVTVSYRAGKWFVSIQTEREVELPLHRSREMCGVDMGVAKFATLSDGQVFKPCNSYRTVEKKLAKLQRDLSRKKRFSENWKKQKQKVQQLHHKIANIRQDYLHKASDTN